MCVFAHPLRLCVKLQKISHSLCTSVPLWFSVASKTGTFAPMQSFQLTLKNDKRKIYRQLSWLIIIANMLIFAYFSFALADRTHRISAIASLVVLAAAIGIGYYFRNKLKGAIGLFPLFLLIMFEWIHQGNYWIAALVFLFMLLEAVTQKPFIVLVSTGQITYPSFPVKNISWDQVSNVILKDGLLTIDFKNNKIIQQLIDPAKTSVNEPDFNDFCRAQLKK
jgi:hypothetical protein